MPAMRISRFTEALPPNGLPIVHIEKLPLKTLGAAKTMADCFRHRRSIALEGLPEALRQRKARPAEIARHTERRGAATLIRPQLEAITANSWDRVRRLAISKEWNQEFDLILTHDKIERLHYRLVQSHRADRFVRNGTMILMTWCGEPSRGGRAYKEVRPE